MSSGIAVILPLVAFAAMILAEVPVAFAMIGTAAIGLLFMDGTNVSTSLSSTAFSSINTDTLILIPMFILMGMLVAHSGVAEIIFNQLSRVVERIPGGLAITTVIASALMGGITGSSAADVATIGRVSIGEMRRHRYSTSMAAGTVAAAGTIAILVPPSIVLIIYGVETGESIGRLLLAGLVPGAITTVAYCLVILVLTHRGSIPRRSQPETVESSAATLASSPRERIDRHRLTPRSVAGLLYGLILFVTVIGGIYSGILTVNESAAVGATVALVGAVLMNTSNIRTLGRMLRASFSEAIRISAMVFALILGAALLTYFLVGARVPDDVTNWVANLGGPHWTIVVLFLAIMLPLAMFLEGLGILLVVIPLTYPIVHSFGYDGIWYGIMTVKMIEISLIMPPLGLNAYVIAGLDKTIKVQEVFRGTLPFVLADLCVVALMFKLPILVTWLPDLAHVK